jgi:hypothetical protein
MRPEANGAKSRRLRYVPVTDIQEGTLTVRDSLGSVSAKGG